MFDVVVAEPAKLDIQNAYDWWAEYRSKEQADRWYGQIYERLKTLTIQAGRYPRAQEYDLHPAGVRQMLFGAGHRPTHRVLFVVDGQEVQVLRVRHVAQALLQPDDLR